MRHARRDYDRIQDPSGKIPADEPVFLLRGQDISAPETLRFWADENIRQGGDPVLSRLTEAHAVEMEKWQALHFSKAADGPRPEASPESTDAKGAPLTGKADVFVLKVNGAKYTSDDDFSFRRRGQSVLCDDVIHQHHTIRLGWLDRFRALFGRAVHLNVQTPVRIVACPGDDTPEVQPGGCKSTAFVEHFFHGRVAHMTTTTKA